MAHRPCGRKESYPPADSDVLVRWRRHHLDPESDEPDGDDLLFLLGRAEYGHRTSPGTDRALLPEDVVTARLRRAARSGTPADPWWLVGLAGGGALQRSALAQAWGATVRAGFRADATAALRSRLLLPASPIERAFLLDLAEEHALSPLAVAECAGAAHSDAPPVRQAAWRYLSGLRGGARVLPVSHGRSSGCYEALLLSAAWQRAAPGHPAGAGYRLAVAGLPAAPAEGIVVAQSMMLGRLEEPGVGASGGMSVLLGALGDALAATGEIARVLTLAPGCGGDLGQGLVARLGTGHWLLRVPVPGPAAAPVNAPELRTGLAWWMARLLALPGAEPAVVHARFADDSSLAVADAARRTGARFAFTVTPDPHRTMGERHRDVGHALCTEPAAALRADLHRVFAADVLADRCDLLVTIPGPAGTREIATHFPQLTLGGRGRRFVSPAEGIPPFSRAGGDSALAADLMRRLFAGGDRQDGLDPSARSSRMFLSVGRLHPVKQQDRLVEAWIEAGLHHRTTLLLVGGSAGPGTAAEREMRERIAKLVSAEPMARRNLACWPALPNRHVRLLERVLAAKQAPYPPVYVCPSAKEEFGLAVLEAMDAGLPAAGPQRGGVPHYIDDGVNGYLLPTHSAPALSATLAALAAVPGDELASIAAAGASTVTGRYSARAMAGELAEAYRLLATEPLKAGGPADDRDS
ncbi:glycosyltransferase [Kitasatospora sp. NPDC101801]|uniref:glycosyltransferase n=1 Tax=Kitasatospora sp. NPDC101801 TaxID=3364103 RepID=UPI0037FDB5E7